MTATLTRPSLHELLRGRLEVLYAERTAALAETAPSSGGDAADRATNVDAQVRLAVLEERISELEVQLSSPEVVTVGEPGVVAVGSTITVDFGDGPETYLLAPVEQAPAGVDVITPGSPLGRALIGSVAGTEVTYHPKPHRDATVQLVTVEL